jgi:hypothetical protein
MRADEHVDPDLPRAVMRQNTHDRDQDMIVDGGLLSHFLVWLARQVPQPAPPPPAPP